MGDRMADKKGARVERARDVDEALQALSAFFDSTKKHATVERSAEGIFIRVASSVPNAHLDEEHEHEESGR